MKICEWFLFLTGAERKEPGTFDEENEKHGIKRDQAYLRELINEKMGVNVEFLSTEEARKSDVEFDNFPGIDSDGLYYYFWFDYKGRTCRGAFPNLAENNAENLNKNAEKIAASTKKSIG